MQATLWLTRLETPSVILAPCENITIRFRSRPRLNPYPDTKALSLTFKESISNVSRSSPSCSSSIYPPETINYVEGGGGGWERSQGIE